MITPVHLSGPELDAVTSRVSPRGGSAARIVHLVASGPTSTHDIEDVTGLVNVPDTIRKCVNPQLDDLGLYLACVRSPVRPQQWFWGIYRDSNAANDCHGGD